MKETLIVLKCEASLSGGSYQIRLERHFGEGAASYVLHYESCDSYVESKSSSETVISELQVKQWFADLSKTSVPVVIDGLNGCDGVTYQLNFYQGLNSSRYHWWCYAPESYRPLVEFGNQLLDIVGHNDRLEIRDSI